MNKNEKYTIEITDVNSEGAGVGRIDGVVVFVPYALPGETVEILIIKVAKNYSVGKILNVIIPSEKRIEPECKYFYRCGGCDFQHLSYNAQLEYKCASTIKNICKISGQKLNIEKIIGADDFFHYRTKAQFPVSKDKDGNIVMGFFSPRSHNVISIDSCLLQSEKCNSIIPAVKKSLRKAKLPVYDEINHKGLVRHAIARSSNNGLMVIVVTNSEKKLPDIFTNALKEYLPEMTSLIQNVNCNKSNIILGNKNYLLYGDEFISDSMCGIKFNLRPLAFLQVNPRQAEKLYKTVLEKADLTGKEIVFDAYCGIGIMSLMLAKCAKKLVGVEIIPEAIDSAKESAEINNIKNADFYAGACENILPELIRNNEKPDVLVVDPPRAGCEESLLKCIANNEIKKIIYVSCDPATLARDIKIMCDLGYKCSDVTFVDMFCQTKHIESVVLMTRNIF